MTLNLIWRLAVVLLWIGLWVHPGVAGNIQQFKDDQGTLHISNAGKAEPDQAEKEVRPTPRRRPKLPAAPFAAQTPASPPAAAEAKQDEAAAVGQEAAAPIAANEKGGRRR